MTGFTRQRQEWKPVFTFPLAVDLTPLLKSLRQRSIVHRVTEERSGQCLWVLEPDLVKPLQEFIRADGIQKLREQMSNTGDDAKPHPLPGNRPGIALRALQLLDRFPVTLLSIYLGVLGALLLVLDHQLRWVSLLTFQPLQLQGNQVQLGSLNEGLLAGQWWRLVTPVFLHFGLFHILFNGLWVWEFGRRIERVFGSFRLLGLFLVLAVISNLVQYLWSGPAMFGGLSGVLYGLLGFLWIYQHRRPTPELAVAPGIIGFMLLWQVLCMSGVVDALISGSIANGAHMGGLIAGMIAGYLSAGPSVRSRPPTG